MNRKALISLAIEQGQSGQVVGDILDVLRAHPDLIDLPRMVAGLLRALRVSELGSPIRIGSCDPLVWREACLWIVSLSRHPKISERLGNRFWLGTPPPTRNPVLSRGVTKYGFPYAALWHAPRDTENAPDYDRLVAQLLAATQTPSQSPLSAQRYAAFLDLRWLCESRHLIIPPELRVWGDTASFVEACRGFSALDSRSENADRFASIARLVRYSQGEEPPTRSGGGGSRGRRGKPVALELTHFIAEDRDGFALGDPDDPDQLPGHYQILTQPSTTDTDIAELAPDELSPVAEIWVLDDVCAERPFVADLLSQRSIENHIIRSRQQLPFTYNQFTLAELKGLLFGASDMFEECRWALTHSQNKAHLQLRMEAILMLHISLWLGQAPYQVVQLTVVDREANCTDGMCLLRGAVSQFCVRVRHPELVGDERWQAKYGFRSSQACLLLPDLAGSSALIAVLLRHFPRTSDHVFTYQVEELVAEVRKVLAVLGKNDPRYTLSKVRNYLFYQIAADTQDVAIAGMLSGVRVPSAQTPQYYLQPRASHLQHIYHSSLGRVLQRVYACAGLAYQLPEMDKVGQHGSVGATHCLLPETIASNVRAMASILRKKPSSTLIHQITWHNVYTLWVVQMFMLSTGCRAIRNPLRFVDDFDSILRMGAIADKDNGDHHMSRLVWAPEMLQRQLAHYLAHCAAISKVLLSASSEDCERWSRGFFLSHSDSGVRRIEIRPATLYLYMEQVSDYIPHRINAYRKFLRTELSERGCPPEALAAFMGHWLRGEEPQDPYSSFCPAAYAGVVSDWITQLLKTLGWYVQGSRWGR